MKKGQKGFTLVELLIVIAIIGILAAVAIPRFQSADTTAKVGAVKANLTSVESAAEIYKAKNGTYPSITLLLGGTDGTGEKYLKRSPDGSPAGVTYTCSTTDGIATATSSKGSVTLSTTPSSGKTLDDMIAAIL